MSKGETAMKRVRVLLLAFACALVLSLPQLAEATIFRRPWRPVRPVRPVVTNHMPGWDWRYIYPYSPYNYGRNPYNPIVYPYPYPYPYPYTPYYGAYTPYSPSYLR
jgi:hypothetical protein